MAQPLDELHEIVNHMLVEARRFSLEARLESDNDPFGAIAS